MTDRVHKYLLLFALMLIWGAGLVTYLHPIGDILLAYRKTPLDPLGQLGMSVNLLKWVLCLVPLFTSCIILAALSTNRLLQVLHLSVVAAIAVAVLINIGLLSQVQLVALVYLGLWVLYYLLTLVAGSMAGSSTSRHLKAFVYLLSLGALLLSAGEFTLRSTKRFTSYAEHNGVRHQSVFSMTSGHDHTYRSTQANDTLVFKVAEFEQIFTRNPERIFDTAIPPKNETEFRILALGDSFTQGIGAVNSTTATSHNTPPDSSWTELLEQKTNSVAPNIKTRVINAGIAGSDIIHQYYLAEVLIPLYQPDLVLLALNRSDHTDIATKGGEERFATGGLTYRTAPYSEVLYANFHLYRFYIHQICGYDVTSFTAPDKKRESEENIINIIERKIYALQALANTHHTGLVVVFHPTVHEIAANQLVLEAVMNNVKDSVAVVDLLQRLNEMGINATNCNQYFWPIDYHHNAKGYNAFAEALLPKAIGWINNHER